MSEKRYSHPNEDDPKEQAPARLRLPFALCKQRGITLPEGATPRDAWNALKGYNINPKTEMERMFARAKKNARAKAKRQEKRERKQQSHDSEHSPDYSADYADGELAGVKKGKPMTFEQADKGHSNPYYGTKGLYGYNENCQTCVVAFEARLRGYDVRALPNNRNPYIIDLSHRTTLAWVDKKGNRPTPQAFRRNNSKTICGAMRDGERWNILWDWKGQPSGHIVTAIKEGGNVKFFDPQTGKQYDAKEFDRQVMSRAKKTRGYRVDNLEIDESIIDYCLKGAKK